CFLFQAEDGIRDFHVTGVQTCALPISGRPTGSAGRSGYAVPARPAGSAPGLSAPSPRSGAAVGASVTSVPPFGRRDSSAVAIARSEERRVGNGGRGRRPGPRGGREQAT